MLETLEKVHEFLNENKLVLTVDKTELIVLGEENNFKKVIYSEKNNTRKQSCQVSWNFNGQKIFF